MASMPTLTFQERSPQSQLRLISNIVPGEVIPEHLFYNPEFHYELELKYCVHCFFYRDPRDVVASEAYYLTYMNRWHRMHPYYRRFNRMEERISTAILGIMDLKIPNNYPNVVERFARYRGWLKCQSVFSEKYEDLIMP